MTTSDPFLPVTSTTASSNSSSSIPLTDMHRYLIAGCAGGGFVLLAGICALSYVYCQCCRCGNKSKKQTAPSEDKINYSLDSVVVPDKTNGSLVNEAAVEKIHKKSNFNINKLIGRSLAKQIEGILLEPHRLTVKDVIGEGNFGVVYKGILTSPSGGEPEIVAVKKITGENINAKDLTAFIDEILRMRHFSHKHVLNMIGLVIEQNLPNVVMPYMANGDLRSYVADPSHFLLARDLAEFGRQVADGMAYLSSQGFIHRDLAARNCMVDERKVVKVADFGLSRDLFNVDYYKADIKTPLPVRWMAVESLKTTKFSVKTDVWSFGVLLWEMFTRGSTPYPGLDNSTVITYVRKGERMKQPPYTPDDIYSLMMDCWHVDPNSRPTFYDIVDTLQRLISGSSDTPHPNYKNLAF